MIPPHPYLLLLIEQVAQLRSHDVQIIPTPDTGEVHINIHSLHTHFNTVTRHHCNGLLQAIHAACHPDRSLAYDPGALFRADLPTSLLNRLWPVTGLYFTAALHILSVKVELQPTPHGPSAALRILY